MRFLPQREYYTGLKPRAQIENHPDRAIAESSLIVHTRLRPVWMKSGSCLRYASIVSLRRNRRTRLGSYC
jgi:hypothetical protein